MRCLLLLIITGAFLSLTGCGENKPIVDSPFVVDSDGYAWMFRINQGVPEAQPVLYRGEHLRVSGTPTKAALARVREASAGETPAMPPAPEPGVDRDEPGFEGPPEWLSPPKKQEALPDEDDGESRFPEWMRPPKKAK